MDKLIAITLPEPILHEAALVELMLRRGIDRVHIRKADVGVAEELIRAIPRELRPRLSVHYYAGLAEKYATGLHLSPGRGLSRGNTSARVVSRSCHALSELSSADAGDYQFLSPIYDSISKSGYKSKFDITTLRVPANTYALGGVTPEKFEELAAAGFCGAAMLGYFWADLKPETIIKRIDAAIYHSHK